MSSKYTGQPSELAQINANFSSGQICSKSHWLRSDIILIAEQIGLILFLTYKRDR